MSSSRVGLGLEGEGVDVEEAMIRSDVITVGEVGRVSWSGDLGNVYCCAHELI